MMMNFDSYVLYFLGCFLISVLLVPVVSLIAHKINAVDKPNWRKVHRKAIPRLGGLAIILSNMIGFFYLKISLPNLGMMTIAFSIIIAIGVLDDVFQLPAKIKLIGQVTAAFLAVHAGVRITYISLPFTDNRLEYAGIIGYILTIIWIVSITNSINLVDGLDGLAAGISCISLFVIMIMAIEKNDMTVFLWSLTLIAATLGFLVYNINPAKIFLGDTGSLFLGFSIALLSVLGFFKSITLFSLVVPFIILGVPIFDTLSAIIRRILNNQSFSEPDKSHLHHRLLAMGFSHRNTVWLIYLLSALFGLAAITFSRATIWLSLIIVILLIVSVQIVGEIIELYGKRRTPLINVYLKFRSIFIKK
ncbi:glycosyltransferase family 4 protein [Pseudalkalibacillus sp. Hm43]|uniref:glycosyltransferase family 4 protein n=1 Tax=Pseudalkalibacillus sp. Hm43 TaxID=3450742 RepID=UPI003F423EB3